MSKELMILFGHVVFLSWQSAAHCLCLAFHFVESFNVLEKVLGREFTNLFKVKEIV